MELIIEGKHYGEKEVQSIIKENEILRKDGASMAIDIKSLKSKIGGYMTANETYRKIVAKLNERVEHYKALCMEGDHLYEERIGREQSIVKDFKAQIAEIQRQHLIVINELNSEHANKIGKLELRIKELNETVDAKQNFITSLQDAASQKMVELSEKEAKLNAQDDIIRELECTVEDLRRPWWKKIF